MYGKVFSSLWHGSLLGQGHAQLVFCLLIAHADRDGNSEAHPLEIATWTGFSPDEITAALEALQAEDPDSRSDEEGGKRIIRAGLNLWHIVNYKKYLAMQDRDVMRENGRERVRRHRAKKRAVTGGNGSVTEAFVKGEGEVEVEKEKTLVPDGTASAWGLAFDRLWKDYPHYGRRSSKAQSRSRWMALRPRPSLDAVFSGLAACAMSEDWTKDSGSFVPALEVWIKKQGWDSSEGRATIVAFDPLARARKLLAEKEAKRAANSA